MGRWQPDSIGRLERAAIELYAERGYEQTTVADIAERAGVTERTYFRHFADKREVLFGGSAELKQRITSAVADAPADGTALEVVESAIEAAADMLHERRDHARVRAALLAANPSLMERELLKMASLGMEIRSGLEERGIPAPTASVAAEAGISVFRVSFDQWIAGDVERDYAAVVRDGFAELRAVAAG